MAIASLILGIASLIMIFLSITIKISFGVIPSICAIIGLILGIMQNKKEKDSKATIGIIAGIIYIVLFIIIAVRGILIMKSQFP